MKATIDIGVTSGAVAGLVLPALAAHAPGLEQARGLLFAFRQRG